MTVSAWTGSGSIKSPDSQMTAWTTEEVEISMGGPLIGKLKTSNGLSFSSCGTSFVWSKDSKYLAVPFWDERRRQKLGLINVATGEVVKSGRTFSVIELSSFEEGVVAGVDSPIHSPRKFTWDVNDVLNAT